VTDPSPAPILDLIEAFRRSKTMFAALALGVFDRLERGPATAEQLAAEIGAQRDALELLLDACRGLGLLDKHERGYALTPAAAVYLCRSSPQTLTGYIAFSNDFLYAMWAHLEDAVREGTNRWKQTYGIDGPLFSHFFKTEESMRDFLGGMHGFGLLSSPAVAAAFDLAPFRHLVDLGGATGHLAVAACLRWPALTATIFDLPEVVDQVRGRPLPDQVAGRVRFATGDFFTGPLPDADLFAMGRILHDWTEEKIALLLRKIHAHLPPGGGLLVSEKLLDEDKAGPVAAHMQSLNMLVCAEGKERSESEYRALFEAAGFVEFAARRTGLPVDGIFARKPA
jgi:acetylserotonin N-methyltransferase